MSKRGAEQTDEEVARYGSYSGQMEDRNTADKPIRATAAQMAARKIAQAKKPVRSRGSTPNPPAFGTSTQTPGQQPNPFAGFQPSGGVDFNFGANGQQQNGANPFGGSSTPTFSFGANPPQPQQNGTPSFGSSTPTSTAFNFGANNPPTQQNGFGNSSTTSFGGFGQTQSQPQQNGNASSSFTFGAAPQPNGGSTFQFGANKPQEQRPKFVNPFASATQSQAQQNGTPAPSFSFGVQKPDEQISKPSFGSFGQQQEPQRRSESPFKSAQMEKQSERQSSTPAFSFGGNNNTAQTPKFGGFGQSQQNGDSSAKTSETPKPSNIFGNLGQPAQTNGDKPSLFSAQKVNEETPKANPFANFGQPSSDKPASLSSDSTPKPAAFAPQSQNEQQKTTNSLFGFGTSQAAKSPEKSDMDMTTPGNTPQKPLFASANTNASEQTKDASTQPAFGSAANKDAPSAAAPIGQGTSLFDRITKEPQPAEPSSSSAQHPFAPATSSAFNPSARDFAQPQEQPPPQKAHLGGSLFDRVEKKPQSSPAPTSNLFSPKLANESSANPSAFTQPAPGFGVISAASHAPQPVPQKSADKVDTLMSTPAPARFAALAPGATPKAKLGVLLDSGEHWTRFKDLNDGFLKFINTQNPTADWTSIMQLYLQKASKISGRPDPLSVSIEAPPAPLSDNDDQFSRTSAAPPAASSSSRNIFSQTSAAGKFTTATPQPPATEPVSKKRAAEQDFDQPPATEKRSRPSEPMEYPKLPENASNTAKLFQAALDRPTAPRSAGESQPNFFSQSALKRKSPPTDTGKATAAPETTFTPSTTSIFANKPSTAEATSQGSKEAEKPAATGFKPAGFTPSFAPTSTSTGGFVSAFGAKAKQQEEKDKQKVRDEEFDSEEDDPEEWERQYQEKQEQKRKAIEDAAKAQQNRGFTPSFGSDDGGASSRASSIFKFSTAAEEKADENQSAPSNPFAKFGSNAPTSAASNLFSASTNKDKDHTWKQGTPLKFSTSIESPESEKGSVTPAGAPPATGLFGNSIFKRTGDSTPGARSIFDQANSGASTPKPLFNFGGSSAHLAPPSTGLSRASTPGITTDGETDLEGEGGEGEPSDDQPQEEVEDKSKLLPEERAQNEVLLELPIVVASKIVKGPDGTGGWKEKGRGPLYILKSKDTGRTRVVVKIPPLGRVAMNFEPRRDMGDYKIAADKPKNVTGPFYDHLEKPTERGIGLWKIFSKTEEGTKEICRLLNEGRPPA